MRVDAGWHPWYEIQQDPENAERLVICGTKWDALHNSPFGFVAATSDGGVTWRVVLEDRSSAWVTEQSCAFGPSHRAYFLSSASRVVDGKPYHEQGTTRLYVSTDSGESWTQAASTGWTDYSTSAFSRGTGRLYTFFNAPRSGQSSGSGARIGLRVFSSNGKIASGPFFDIPTRSHLSGSLYPSDAVGLKDGSVAALYYGAQPTPGGLEVELGIVHVDGSKEPLLERNRITHAVVGSACVNFDDGALAYDSKRDILFVVYLDGCTRTQLMLTTSEDHGKTWAESRPIQDPDYTAHEMSYPSLVVRENGGLSLLWEEGRQSERWYVADIENGDHLGAAEELSRGVDPVKIRNDGLRYWTGPRDQRRLRVADDVATASITVHIEDDSKVVWRGRGLLAMGSGMIAIWPLHDEDGMHLCSIVIRAIGPAPDESPSGGTKASGATDVTGHVALLYGGEQHYDSSAAIFRACMMLGNRGDRSIKAPIQLQALTIESPFRILSVSEGSGPMTAPQATWDISASVPDGKIAPGAHSNPFCLSLQLQTDTRSNPGSHDLDLLTIKFRVSAATETNSP